jgi:diguanylate cyclase (GGDEF)-like protein/PAS domain S-box-containing protein
MTDAREPASTRDADTRVFQLIFERSPTAQALLSLGTESRVVANPAMAAMLGMPVEAFDDLEPMSVIHPDDRHGINESMDRLAAGEAPRSTVQLRLVRADGSIFPAHIAATSLQNEDGEFLSLLITVDDVTERVELERRALHDDLTGLPNRAALSEYLDYALRRRTPQPCAALFIDLDNFKTVNDRFGHAAGDDLLVDVAKQVRANLREGDIAARVGGDEFVVVCELDAVEHAFGVGERIRLAIQQGLDDASPASGVTASVGVAVARAGDDPDALIRRADAAAYIAKRSGKSRSEILGAR